MRHLTAAVPAKRTPKRTPKRKRRRMTASERAARAALFAAVHPERAVPETLLIASLTPHERVERMALHKMVTGSFGPDLARKPGT